MGTTTVLTSSSSWQLRVDVGSGGLIDTRCVRGGDCTVHPNPFECEDMQITVSPNGGLCGRCAVGGAMREDVCGGLEDGLPYSCELRLEAAAACVVCRDLRGQQRYRDCSNTALPAPSGSVGPTSRAGCLDLHDKVSGAPCAICLGEAGQIVSNTCGVGTGGGDISPTTPQTPPMIEPPPSVPDDGVGSPNDSPGFEDDGQGAGQTPPPNPCEPTFLVGSQAFMNELNRILDEARLQDLARSAELPEPGFSADDSRRHLCNSNHEEHEFGEWTDHLRHDPDNLWTRSGGSEVRCNIMVNIATERAYQAPCDRRDECLDTFLAGAVAERNSALRQLNDRYRCVGSPIVLDLDGDGITSERRGTRFDLSGIGEPLPTAWIRQGDALLARDVDGDGRITSGVELFGDITATGILSDGYAALARIDDNGDGAIDPRDPSFGSLLLWADDGDGVSDATELVSLHDAGIASIDVRPVSAPSEDAAGSELALWSTFERVDGSRGATCDVFFADSVD